MTNLEKVALDAEAAWQEYCIARHIRNPLAIRLKNISKKCIRGIENGIPFIQIDTDIPDETSLDENEMERYNDLHHEFIGLYIFMILGYWGCVGGYNDVIDSLKLKPCERDGQCSFECPYYGESHCQEKVPRYSSKILDIFNFIKDVE